MPRHIRHNVPGGWCHVTTRELDRRDIFDVDREWKRLREQELRTGRMSHVQIRPPDPSKGLEVGYVPIATRQAAHEEN